MLDGHSPAALAVTRSLGRAKHLVAVGSNLGLDAPAASSRYCRLSFKHPVPSEDVSGFLEAVLQFAHQNAIELIIPVTDWTVLPLSKHRERFEGVCRVALGPALSPRNRSRQVRDSFPGSRAANPCSRDFSHPVV